MGRGLRTAGYRLDRGSELAPSALAPAVPMVLRNHAVDVEAQAIGHRARAVLPLRPAVPALPGLLSGPFAADRSCRRPGGNLRADLPQPGQRRCLLAGIHRTAAAGLRLRPADRP